jgi:hypothetical protein
MKKSKLFAAVLLIAMFSSVFTVANFNTPVSGSTEIPTAPEATPDGALGDQLGTKGIWVANVTGTNTIIADGDPGDWTGVPGDVFNGVTTLIAYNKTHVSVGLIWVDSSNDMKISEWNKTGSATADNATHGTWDHLDGAVDMVAVGWTNSSGYSDIWVWDASIRGDASYAYEVNGTWDPDTGDTSFMQNIDTGVLYGWEQPEYDNSSVAIPDHDALANGTAYVGWFDDTPTLSQTDVWVGATWNASGDDSYVVEMVRELDTGDQTDDILLDFTEDLTFWVGGENKQDCKNMEVGIASFAVAHTNEPALFSWDIITNPITEALLITGVVWDDYLNFDIFVRISGWTDTYYGPNYWGTADFNVYTGDWSYLFYFDEDDLPLGDHTLNISFVPKYDATNDTYQNITIDDITAPQVTGLVDMNERYPCGVPNGTDYIPITVGVSDDYQYWVGGLAGYTDKDLLTVQLYSWKDDDVALMTPMEQFASGGSTFSANITLPAIAAGETYNYTYFVQVWDPSNNKVTSEYFWFIHGDICLPTPGFGILAGLFGLAGAAFIIYKKRK